ncbi:Photosystem I reaction center subunit IX [Halomicronema hongdechloris C2206]|uniref:Photosystem I reaction center subunit IX n=1 Tax=Halomicronema hongdechloris C2206 TaxID=1641165 RepID=A0A1Z3HIS7_9CYAN|nr:photosystem I reaction center subunit IX [Halomicronema hongdechloris]ASC70166.1 Photosystem I reaction center subunit IX [Halomicronema hongdechloris C2206]
MSYFVKYLTSAPVMATLALVILSVVMIELNHIFPGLQYGTYFHVAP